jgi:HSP20 family molecular chaperone IbpA
VLLVAGQKVAAVCEHGDAAFHIAERSFGRFARAIQVDGAFDAGRATATLANGELRILLARRTERRGAQIRIPIQR